MFFFYLKLITNFEEQPLFIIKDSGKILRNNLPIKEETTNNNPKK